MRKLSPFCSAMNHLQRLLLPLSIWLLSAPACTTTASLDLTPSPVSVQHQNLSSVQVSATGTGRSFGIGARRVGSTDLEQALRTAILEAGLFVEVALGGDADWRLEVSMERLQTSDPSLTMKSTAHLRWRLINRASNHVRWESVLKSEGKAEPRDSDDFGERDRISTERAISKNIAEGMRRIGSLVL